VLAINARSAEKHKEKRQAYKAEWHKANAERIRRKVREWVEANPERHKENVARAYERLRQDEERWQRENERKQQWKRDNPEAMRAMSARRQAALLGAEGKCDGEALRQMYDQQQGLCAYCETVLFGDFHVDHMMPLSRGGSNNWDNLAITCPKCNLSKGAKTAEEFFNCRSLTPTS
jgi:5-methylcytosine-specific restriction endonuclease McrA